MKKRVLKFIGGRVGKSDRLGNMIDSVINHVTFIEISADLRKQTNS